MRRVLELVYPAVDWRRVTFHRGMPHLLNAFPQAGITLPAPLHPGRVRIYLQPAAWERGELAAVALAVHEGFHVQQIQDVWRGWGLGLLRPFYVLYLACSAANRFRYPGHPLEADAFRLAGSRSSRFEREVSGRAVPWGELCRPAAVETLELYGLDPCCRRLAVSSSGLSFWRRLADSTPFWRTLTGTARHLLSRSGRGWRLVALPPTALLVALAVGLAGVWLLLWSAATALLWLTELLLLAAGFAAVGLLHALAAAFSSSS